MVLQTLPAEPHAGPTPAVAWAWLAGYAVLVVTASLIGGALPGKLRLTHARMQHVISLVAGLMLGVATLHLLPHATAGGRMSADAACGYMLGGVVAMFLLLRAFHFHVHEPAPLMDEDPAGPDRVRVDHECSAPGHDHGHDHSETPRGRLGWAGMFFGMSVHTLIDGFALGAAVAAGLSHDADALFPGIGILAAVALHKPLDAMSVTALMQRDGWSAAWRAAVNGLLAAVCPFGAAMLLWGLSGGPSLPTGPVLAFSAGVFLTIALSDLLPEMEFHSHDRFTLTLSLLAGIALSVAIRFLEPGHLHGP